MINVVKCGSVLPPRVPLCAFYSRLFLREFDRGWILGFLDENEAKAVHIVGLFNKGV